MQTTIKFLPKALWATILLFFLQVMPLNAQVAEPGEKEKMGFLRKILMDVFYQPPLKKQVKAILKKKQTSERLDALEAFLKEMETGESEIKQQMLLETPCSYYTFLGLYWKFINPNESKAFEAFSIAVNIRRETIKLSEKDKYILERITTWLKKFGIAGHPFNLKSPITSLTKWVEKDVNNRTENAQSELNKLKHRASQLVKEITELSSKQLSVTIERDSLVALAKNYEVTLSGFTMDNYKQALKEVQAFMKQNAGADLTNITEQLPSGAIIRIREDSPSKSQRPVFGLKEYDLGKYCEYDIRESSRAMITTTLELIRFKEKFETVPEEYKQQIKIQVRIKGNADGNKIALVKGISTMKYKGPFISETSYFSYNSKAHKRVSFSDGTPIYDDDLGFLRAYCAYSEIEQVLTPFRQAHIQIEYIFESEVYEEKGEAYRGVEVDFQVHGLFNHLLDRIKILNRDIRLLQDQIDKKQGELTQIEKEIKKKSLQLEEEQKRITSLSNSINQNLNKKT
jgi:hypothetical protein